MRRREFLRAFLSGVAGYTLDVDRLLWIPGQKTIFLPSQQQTEYFNIINKTHAEIVALELERIVPYIKPLFERDSVFYAMLKGKK